MRSHESSVFSFLIPFLRPQRFRAPLLLGFSTPPRFSPVPFPSFPAFPGYWLCPGEIPVFSGAGQTMEPALAGIIHATKTGGPSAIPVPRRGFFRATLRKEISWHVQHSRAISGSALGAGMGGCGGEKNPFGLVTKLPGFFDLGSPKLVKEPCC